MGRMNEMEVSIIRQSAAATNVARTLWLGGVRLNLFEVTWLVSCTSVSDHYSIQCPKPMSFGYLYAVGSGELIKRLVEQSFNANMATENFR